MLIGPCEACVGSVTWDRSLVYRVKVSLQLPYRWFIEVKLAISILVYRCKVDPGAEAQYLTTSDWKSLMARGDLRPRTIYVCGACNVPRRGFVGPCEACEASVRCPDVDLSARAR